MPGDLMIAGPTRDPQAILPPVYAESSHFRRCGFRPTSTMPVRQTSRSAGQAASGGVGPGPLLISHVSAFAPRAGL